MHFGIVKSYKSAKPLKPSCNNKITIENKTRFKNSILLSLVNHIVDTAMPNIKKDQDNARVRFVFTECSWGRHGRVSTYTMHDNYFEVFVSICKDKDYYFYFQRKLLLLDIEEAISIYAARFYRLIVHELQHLDDKLFNFNGGNLAFAKVINDRRTRWGKRPQEIRAMESERVFQLDEGLKIDLEWDIYENLF